MAEKIAFPTNDGKTISGHFGRCKHFKVVEIKNDEVVSQKNLETPAHQPGLYPKALADAGVDCVIVSGMGRKAVDIFNKNNINVIMGHSGDIDSLIKDYIDGNLSSEGDPCEH
ncbi:MAG TPA: NifB/NifX family molybdenum-iron cluster-binding protein [Candidatus Mcinerneyibacterium sp.]|nr:NifB/NifX family molybdenum-iron cluster-binding protein [Candidatus Mcinerneyibacterium sp.]